MADLSDVRDSLAALATTACYPNGTSSSSVTTRQVTIGGGWPEPADVDTAMFASRSIVSIYAVPGAAAKEEQVFEPPFVVTPALHGMAVNLNNLIATVTGSPLLGEYLAFVIDDTKAYSQTAVAGDTNVTIAAAIAAQISVDYPGTVAAGGVITIVGAHSVVARIGAIGTLGQLLHRQRQQFRITIFAPTDQDRKIISSAVDVLFKQNIHLTFSDTSQGIMTYVNVMEDDKSEKFGNFRRGLVYDVCYGTVMTWTAYEVTSVGMTSTIGTTTDPPASFVSGVAA